MPVWVQAGGGTSRTVLGALTAAAALRSGVGAATSSGLVHHGWIPAVEGGGAGGIRGLVVKPHAHPTPE